MNFRRRKKNDSHLEGGALSDILFILMLFFLMISTMISSDAIKVSLPRAGSSKAVPKDIIPIYVTSDLKCFIRKDAVDMEQLRALLEVESKKYKNPNVILKADKGANWGRVVEVIDVIRALNLPFSVATDRKK